MFEFLQESIQENNMLYIENGISTIEDCVYAYETAQTYDDYMLITESLSSSVSAVFQRIADAFQKILDAFRNLFNSKEQEDLKNKLQQNPEAAKTKVKVADQKQLNDLYDEATKKIKNGEDPEEVQSWFKKHAKGIAATAAVTMTAGALLFVRERNNKNALEAAKKRGDDFKRLYKDAQAENTFLRQKGEYMDAAAKNIERDRDEIFIKSQKIIKHSRELEQENERLSRQNQNLSKRVRSYHDKYKDAQAELNQSGAQASRDAAKLKGQLAQAQAELNKITADRKKAEKIIASNTREINGLTAQINALKASGTADKKQISTLTSKVNSLKSELNTAEKNNAKLSRAYDHHIKLLDNLGYKSNNVSAHPAKRAAQSAAAKAANIQAKNAKAVFTKDAKNKADAAKQANALLAMTKTYQEVTEDIYNDAGRAISAAISGKGQNAPNPFAVKLPGQNIDTLMTKSQQKRNSTSYMRNGGRYTKSSADDLFDGDYLQEYGYEDYDNEYDLYDESEEYDDYFEDGYDQFSYDYDESDY